MSRNGWSGTLSATGPAASCPAAEAAFRAALLAVSRTRGNSSLSWRVRTSGLVAPHRVHDLNAGRGVDLPDPRRCECAGVDALLHRPMGDAELLGGLGD
jgi:hypothetical protein